MSVRGNVENQAAGLLALEREMGSQGGDARLSFEAARERSHLIADAARASGRLLLLGMGGSHAVNRTVEPFYRALGLDAHAMPLSEQLVSPLPLHGRTVLVASQSGESAEVLRWFAQARPTMQAFGLTLEATSSLARLAPSLVGVGGTELAFAATRSLTITLAQHLAILAALGLDPGPALDALANPPVFDIDAAVAALADVRAVVTSGRLLRGLAEALALGLSELSREPAFALEGGQLRHGPMEMLGPGIGALHVRADEPDGDLVAALAGACVEAGAPTVVFDASGGPPVPGAVTVAAPRAKGMAAVFRLLPLAQRFMVAHAGARVPDVGTPQRSTKITRTE